MWGRSVVESDRGVVLTFVRILITLRHLAKVQHIAFLV